MNTEEAGYVVVDLDAHAIECDLLVAATCPVGVECEHGLDVCPTCDPCTCRQ